MLPDRTGVLSESPHSGPGPLCRGHGFAVRHQGVRQSGVIRDGTSLRFVPD